MKKIGKNTKLYLIGMIIGGITLGITTVIADTIINSTSVSYKTTTVKAALDELYDIADFKEEVKDMLYPVGSIYISVSSTNPSELFGGTWEEFSKGRTLIGVGRLGDVSNTYLGNGTIEGYESYFHHNSEITGGELYHTLSVNEMPSHGHDVHANYRQDSLGSYSLAAQDFYWKIDSQIVWSGANPSTIHGSRGRSGVTTSAGSSSPHNNMQPYITVFMWKRTA